MKAVLTLSPSGIHTGTCPCSWMSYTCDSCKSFEICAWMVCTYTCTHTWASGVDGDGGPTPQGSICKLSK